MPKNKYTTCEECGTRCEDSDGPFDPICEECREMHADSERIDALQQIAVAAGIELATPTEIARIVCEKLKEARK